MRQWPSERMEIIKRNFYPRNKTGEKPGEKPEVWRIDDMIVVQKGTYAAFRLGQVSILFPLIPSAISLTIFLSLTWEIPRLV